MIYVTGGHLCLQRKWTEQIEPGAPRQDTVIVCGGLVWASASCPLDKALPSLAGGFTVRACGGTTRISPA